MYIVSPFPDFDDAEKVQQYIQDRRVIGVGALAIEHATLFTRMRTVRSPGPACAAETRDHLYG